MNTGKSVRYGRGHGSFRERGVTPERQTRSSFKSSQRHTDFNPKQFITADCNEREVSLFKQVFDYLDDDHDGMLTPLDLRKAIKEYGHYNPNREFVYVAMSLFDADDGGQITFKEFVKIMTTRPYQQDTEQDIEHVFNILDEQSNGFISAEDLLAVAEELKEQVNPRELKQMIENVDPTGNGVISLQAFIAFNKKAKFKN